MRSRIALLATALVAAAAVADGAAGDGGPSPGVIVGWDGVRAPGAAVRYVALPGRGSTVVAAVRVRDGRVLRFNAVKGIVGVPQVAFDGTTDGLAADGRTLVLSSFSDGRSTRFVVLRTRTLRVAQEIALRGYWAFDAISPDGSHIYATQYQATTPTPKYRVRAIDASSGRVLPGALVDKRELGEQMQGSPMARAFGPGRGWAYTLYGKPDGTAFVHALDTRRRAAICIELPWRGVQDAIWAVRMAVSADGRTLTLRQSAVGRLAEIDLQRFRVRSLRAPVAPAA